MQRIISTSGANVVVSELSDTLQNIGSCVNVYETSMSDATSEVSKQKFMSIVVRV